MLTRADVTTRNRRKADRLGFAYDDLEARIAELARAGGARLAPPRPRRRARSWRSSTSRRPRGRRGLPLPARAAHSRRARSAPRRPTRRLLRLVVRDALTRVALGQGCSTVAAGCLARLCPAQRCTYPPAAERLRPFKSEGGGLVMHQYELMVILDPEIDERTVAPSLDKFLNVIRNDGGTIDNVDIWGRRRLAYEIDKKTEGIYAVVNLTANPRRHRRARPPAGSLRGRPAHQGAPRRRGHRAWSPSAKKLADEKAARKAAARNGSRRHGPLRDPGRQPAAPRGCRVVHGRRDRHHGGGQPHRRPRAALHAERARSRELHDRVDPSHVRPRRRTSGRTATRCSSVRVCGASSPSTWPPR